MAPESELLKDAEGCAPAQDILARHGYKQELKREVGWFSSFANFPFPGTEVRRDG